MPTRARHCSPNDVPQRASTSSAAVTMQSLVYSDTATQWSWARYDANVCAAAPKRPSSTHDRTTLVMSEPTASAMVVTGGSMPIDRQTSSASTTTLACGVR